MPIPEEEDEGIRLTDSAGPEESSCAEQEQNIKRCVLDRQQVASPFEALRPPS